MPGVILVVTTYVLLVVFLVGFVARTVRLARLPVHLRWELAPIPHEKGKGHYGGSYLEELDWWTKPREKSLVAELRYMLLEIVFLKAVFEHNRRLWWFSFPFHFGLYVLVAVAAVVLLAAAGAAVGWGAAAPAVRAGVTGAAGLGYALGAIGALGLLVKRALEPGLRDFTSPAARFNLVLLLTVFGTGIGAVATADYATSLPGYLGAVLTANLAVTVPPIVAAHVLVTCVFLAYLPFTTMMHFVAKYFTYHEVRWNDEPMMPGSRMEKEVERLLAQPVTWAGPHLHADGKKNWVDIATEEVGK
ncbi:MAG: respiratory nitrate reductase subunit gamma [Gemmatimonadota bacterium]|nr:respiratory nitrate reductase subunit gamma [Gemmatimonadota bacterium]MDH5196888.1 respiratory nitrate reductase subunit gamma [Gemmatimonadota bacterium]